MSSATPRLRMFAGPNGSGKTTIKSIIRPELLGVYVNPDDIEAEIRETGSLDLQAYRVQSTTDEVRQFFSRSTLLAQSGLLMDLPPLRCEGQTLSYAGAAVNAYLASVTADFIRHRLLETGISFTFETVMSSPDKIEFLKRAQLAGFRTYLYYVATEDPLINISRVRHRVKMGKHAVPEDKIVSRYYRSLDLLRDAIRYTNRAYCSTTPTMSIYGWLR